MKNFLKTERIGPEVSQSVNQSVEVSQQYRRKAMNCVQVFSLACLLIQNVLGEDLDVGGKIKNGKKIKTGEFPFFVKVFTGTKWCGGTIISEDKVVTAAHCLKPIGQEEWIDPKTVLVMSGDLTLDPLDEKKRYVQHEVMFYKYFKEWERMGKNSDGYDIVELTVHDHSLIQMDKHRETLAPCSQSYGTHDQVTDLGMEVRAMGMGYTDEELRTKPEKLQDVTFDEVDQKVCTDFYNTSVSDKSIICFGIDTNRATCQEDDGGPLFLYYPPKKEARCLYGVISENPEGACGHPKEPHIATRVSYYYEKKMVSERFDNYVVSQQFRSDLRVQAVVAKSRNIIYRGSNPDYAMPIKAKMMLYFLTILLPIKMKRNLFQL